LQRRGAACFAIGRESIETGMASRDIRVQHQCGVLPFAITDEGELRVMLVTTRGSGTWVIPKGWPDRKLTVAASAVREAYEEAGLLGSLVGDEPVGCYRYEKRNSSRRAEIFEVSVFLFAVERQLAKWPEKAQRKTRWFDLAEASASVASTELADILQSATQQLIRAS
jgi:8-oxo-dGTP pyrophosphatase MutT (NUDIX family)